MRLKLRKGRKIESPHSKHYLKGPAKRTEEDDRNFTVSFEQMIQESLNAADCVR